MFELTKHSIHTKNLRDQYTNTSNGALVSFEGIVRSDKHNKKEVASLLYIADEPACLIEGNQILREAVHQFSLNQAICVQRIGDVSSGQTAIWIGVWSSHRDEAFKGCRYIIEETKKRLLIWKKEFFTDGTSNWVRGKLEITNV